MSAAQAYPDLTPLLPDNIPHRLRERDQWVCWRLTPRGDSTWTKQPLNARTGTLASTTNSATWSTFDQALNAATNGTHGVDGIGFVITDDDPFVGIDFDHVDDHPELLGILDGFSTYQEASPSGTGVHLILEGTLPGDVSGRRKGPVEIYERGRFFTMTGHTVEDVPAEPRRCDAALESLWNELFPPVDDSEPQEGGRGTTSLSDGEVVERATNARNGGKFRDLYFSGSVANYHDDDSAADLALLSILAFWTQDRDQLERLFTRSALGQRPKWQRLDYRERTIDRALDRTEYYTASTSGTAASTSDPDGFDEPDRTVFTLQTRRASEIEPRDIDFIWPPGLPAGMITLLAGYGGSGKSTVALTIVAACSTGGPLPDGQTAPLVNSLILAAEDSPEHTIVPRLIGLKANLERIHIVDGIRRNADDPGWVQLRAHVALIERAVMEQQIGLVIIDPVSSYIGDANGDKESDVRSALMPVVAMAERTGAAVLLICHVSKAGDGVRAASRILGSTAWHDIPRVAWMLADAPDEHQPEAGEDGLRATRRVLGVVKSNLSAKPQARWCEQPIDGPLRWFPDASPVTIDECFFAAADRGSRGRNAEDWLKEHLAGGSKPTRSVTVAAKDAGISFAALKRARAALNVTARKEASGEWVLSLPPQLTTVKTEGVHDQSHTGHISEMNALHNTSRSKGFTVNPLNPLPEYQGNQGDGEGPERGPEHGTLCKAFNSPLKGPVEPLPPIGTDGGDLDTLPDADRTNVANGGTGDDRWTA